MVGWESVEKAKYSNLTLVVGEEKQQKTINKDLV